MADKREIKVPFDQAYQDWLDEGERIKRYLGICDSFQGTGKYEWRDGTYSEFCTRCGHPYGYHDD